MVDDIPGYLRYNVSSVQKPFSLMIAGEYTKGLLIQYIRDYHNQLGNPFLSNQCKGTLRVLNTIIRATGTSTGVEL